MLYKDCTGFAMQCSWEADACTCADIHPTRGQQLLAKFGTPSLSRRGEPDAGSGDHAAESAMAERRAPLSHENHAPHGRLPLPLWGRGMGGLGSTPVTTLRAPPRLCCGYGW